MPCEMCGREAPLRPTLVEGTQMQLCPDCQKYGKAVTKAPEVTNRSRLVETMQQREKRARPRDVFADNPETLAEDYGTRVKRARTKKGQTLEELAKEINEKKSVVSRTETMDHHPSDRLVKKLERALDITLMETPECTSLPAGQGPSKKASGPVTLGDLLKDAINKEEGQ